MPPPSMGAAPEVRLVIKHTFLEFVEERSLGKPSRQRAFTDSALAGEGGHCDHRQQVLNATGDVTDPAQELLPAYAPCGATASSSSSAAPSARPPRADRDARLEANAVLGMTSRGKGEPAPLAAGRGRGAQVGGRHGAMWRPGQETLLDAGVCNEPRRSARAPGAPASASASAQRAAAWREQPTQGVALSAQAPVAGKAWQVQRIRGRDTAGTQAAQLPESSRGTAAGQREDQLTTVLFRNLPNSFTRAMFLDLVDSEGFAGAYNFVYTPVDFTSQAGLGYAFINFISPAVARYFWAHFDGYTNWPVPSEKAGVLNWSSPHQGLAAHVERYRNSPVMHSTVPDDWKPAVFVDGVRVAFPQPTKVLKAPKIRHALGGTQPGA